MATKNLTLPVTGMTCASCASRIERGLNKVEGVENAQVNLASEQATITYDPQQARPSDLVAAVERSGYGVIANHIELPITGMTCASCVARVEKALKKVDGVLDASVNLATERATVTYAAGAAGFGSLQAAVEAAGYGVIAPAQDEAGEPQDTEATARQAELADKRRKLLIAVAFGLPLFLLSMARDFGLIAPWLTPFWAANEALMEAVGAHAEGVSTLMHYPARAGSPRAAPAQYAHLWFRHCRITLCAWLDGASGWLSVVRRSFMSFQGYLNTIKAKTGKGPDDFRRLAAEKGFTDGEHIKPDVKAGDIVAWLKQDFDLGHGHAMAIYALLKGSKSEDSE